MDYDTLFQVITIGFMISVLIFEFYTIMRMNVLSDAYFNLNKALIRILKLMREDRE